jgi:hypothetical protein
MNVCLWFNAIGVLWRILWWMDLYELFLIKIITLKQNCLYVDV